MDLYSGISQATEYFNAISSQNNNSYKPNSKPLSKSALIMKEKSTCIWGGNILSLAISPDNLFIISGSTDSLIRIWSMPSFKHIGTLSGHAHWVTCIYLSLDNTCLISGSYDMTVKSWDLAKARCKKTLHHAKGSILSLCCNERYLATSSIDLSVRLYSYKRLVLLYDFRGHTDWVTGIEMSKNSEFIVSCSTDSWINIWNIKEKRLDSSLYYGNSGCNSIVLSKDDKYIVAGYEDGIVRVWNSHTKQREYAYKTSTLSINSLGISKDSRYVVSGVRDGSFVVWDIVEKKIKKRGKTDWGVNVVKFSEDNRYCILGCVDTSIHIYRFY
jgi:WD40 repeat protein